MKQYLFSMLCFFFISGSLFAQNTETEPPAPTEQETPSDLLTNTQSANAASSTSPGETTGTASDYATLMAQSPTMPRDIQSSVDYYTGTAKVNVPLYTISASGVQIPIGVQYTASGIKTDTYPSWVGLNWKLTGIGRISRFINGQPDETGFLDGHGKKAANSDANEWKSSAISDKIDDGFDGEPDLYFFELPNGQSGLFVIDHDSTIAVIPYQDITIEWKNNEDYATSYFVITDAQGLKYRFGSKEVSREHSSNENYERTKSYVSAWMLDDISFGNEIIVEYAYRSSPTYSKDSWNYLYRFEYKPASQSHRSLETVPLQVISQVAPRVLTSITWDLGKLEFDLGDADNYVRTGPYLRKINVYGYNNEYLKTIHFDMSLFSRYLDHIYEESGDLKKDICSFEYNPSPGSLTFPLSTWQFDYWGYFNGGTYTPGYPSHMIMGYNVTGHDKTPNLECTKGGTLQKILYPSGGWTELEYELHQGRLRTPNTTVNEWNGSLETAGGLRIKSISHYESENTPPSTTQYVYQDSTDTKKGGQIFTGFQPFVRIRQNTGSGSDQVVIYSVTHRPDYTMTDLTGSSVIYNYVKEILPNGSYNEYEFNGFDACMDIKGQAALSSSDGIDVYRQDFENKVPYSTMFFGRGNLKKKTQYDSNGQVVYTESYTYELPSAAVKATVYSYPLFTANEESSSVKYYKGRYQWISQPALLVEKTVSAPEPYSKTVLSYHPDYLDVLPRTIEVTDAQGDCVRSTTTYAQDYTVAPIYNRSLETYGLYWLQQNGVKAAPIETINYKKKAGETAFNVIGASLNLYSWSPAAERCFVSQTKSLLLGLPLSTTMTPLSVSGTSLIKDSRYDTDNPQVTELNHKGNPVFTTYSGANGPGTHILYGYDGAVPIAQVEGSARSTHDFYTSFEEVTPLVATVFLGREAKTGNYALKKNTSYRVTASSIGTPTVLSYWRWDGSENTTWEQVTKPASNSSSYIILEPNHYVDEVRLTTKGATMTTQVIQPGVGTLSTADARGTTTRYNYNSLGMLESIEKKGRIVERYSYREGTVFYNASAQVANNSLGQGRASVNLSQVSPGGSVTFTATPETGYQFSQWQFSDGTTSSQAVTVKNNIQADISGIASFTGTLYNLTASVASQSSSMGQASVTPNQVTVGQSATWTATAHSGYEFDHWEFSDGTTATTSSVTKTNIAQNLSGTAFFREKAPQSVNFIGSIMPKEGYWAVRIVSSPDIISDGSEKVFVSGYFFINPNEPDRIDAQFEGTVRSDGYVLSNALYQDGQTTGELNGQISITDSNYTVGTVQWIN